MNETLDYALERSAPWPLWISALVVTIVASFVLVAYLLERTSLQTRRLPLRLALTAIRASLVILLVLMLYRWARQPYETERPDLVIAIDDSQSMSHADRYADGKLSRAAREVSGESGDTTPSRLALAQSLLLARRGELLTDLSERYNIKLYFLADAARLSRVEGDDLAGVIREASADRPASLLGQGLRDALEAQRGHSTAAILLFTDGATTAGPSLLDGAELARRQQTPLFIVGLGDPATPRDVWIGDLLADEAIFLGDSLAFEARIRASGYRGAKIEVRLSLAGSSEVLDRRTIVGPADGESAAVALKHRPSQAGDYEYVVSAVPLARESRRDNNERRRRVSVRQETIRVLYVQEYPSGDFRYLKNLLGRSAAREESSWRQSFSATTVLQEAEPRFASIDENSGAFPANREELFAYDCVIFGDVNPARLSQREMTDLVAFVSERGGGVVFIAGPRHTPLAYRDTPLAELFPIDLASASSPAATSLQSPIQARLTKLGEASPMLALADEGGESRRIWSELPGLFWLLSAPSLKPGARVLVVADGSANQDAAPPVLVEQYLGAGKVVFIASDDTWRWRFRAGDRYFGRFWVQTLRDLARAKLRSAGGAVELASDRKEYRQGEPVSLSARFRDGASLPREDRIALQLERDGVRATSIQLARSDSQRQLFTATARQLPAGEYRGRLARASGSPPSESPSESTSTSEVSFTIVAPPGELARLEMNLRELRQAAKSSRGEFYTLSDGDRWADELPRGERLRVRQLAPEPIWNSPWVAAIFLSLLAAEWMLRRRAGML